MIFLTIGSHEPFDRLIEAVDRWCAASPSHRVFGQITDKGTYRPQHFAWQAYLDVNAYTAACANAELLIAHAGMGSIITALDIGKPIVIMPRRGHLRETRNDHQYATAKQFRGKPGIFVADDETLLAAEIERALQSAERPDAASSTRFAQPQLVGYLAGLFGK